MLDLRFFLPKPPFVLIAALVLGAAAALVPVAMFLKHRASFHERPRIHLWQDMDNQPKLKTQAESAVFADGRAMRPPVPGTVARGQLDTDDHLHRGFTLVAAGSELQTEYLPGFPDGITVDESFVKLGQQRYNAMCYPCHGKDGRGNGPVNVRANALMAATNPAVKVGTNWVTAADLIAADETGAGGLKYGEDKYPNGELYNVIANGKGNMVGYSHAIPVAERWAIVAYVRALQLAQETDAVQAAWAEQDASNTPQAVAQNN